MKTKTKRKRIYINKTRAIKNEIIKCIMNEMKCGWLKAEKILNKTIEKRRLKRQLNL